MNRPHFQLVNATISSVHHALSTHQLTCVGLIKLYLNRIKKYDLALNRGAPINAIVAINPSILNEAKQLDADYAKTGRFVGPLHCIPVIVKDNIDTVDSPSTSGSLSLLGSQPIKNAFIVKKLRQAGAIILGKGAMDEFASGMDGMSSRSGRVGNAYDPNQNPGGSSAGPAAAVSANFTMVAIGTDNSGSVRVPAVFNGVFGIRPSTGLISQSGIFPRGNLDGVAGPIARNITDLAKVLAVIAKTDPNDPKTKDVSRTTSNSYIDHLQANYLKGKRIGVIRSVAGINPFAGGNQSVENIFQNALNTFKLSGAILVNVRFPKFNTHRKNNMAGEVQDINHYLSSFPSTRKNYRDICQSGLLAIYSSIKECFDHIKNTANRKSRIYQAVLNKFKKNRQYVEHIMKKNRLDAIIMPVNAHGPASYDITAINTWHTAVSSNSGLPALTIIAGYSKGKIAMPIGMELIGKMYDESELIHLAYSYQQHAAPLKTPQLGSNVHSKLMTLTIPEFNNLIIRLGYRAYTQVLKKNSLDNLTAKKFKTITQKLLKKQ